LAAKKQNAKGQLRLSVKAEESKYTYTGYSYGVLVDLPYLLENIKASTEATALMEATFGKKEVVTKEIEKIVEKPANLTDAEIAIFADALKIKEHQIHAATRDDYIHNGGANWQELHTQAQAAMDLRTKLSLPAHPFSSDCCVIEVDGVDLAAIAITAHGINAAEKDRMAQAAGIATPLDELDEEKDG